MNNIRATLAIVWRIAVSLFPIRGQMGRAASCSPLSSRSSCCWSAPTCCINQWRNRFYNALQEMNWNGFVREMHLLHRDRDRHPVALSVYQLYLNQWLQIRWRNWMTTKYLGEWLHDANHYRMQLQGDAADNPDQRISDDVKLFVERTLDDRPRLAELDRHASFPLS